MKSSHLHVPLFCLLTASFWLRGSAIAAPGDEHWSPQFGYPGTTNVVLTMATHNGRLYTSGYRASGGLTNCSLNVWDGYQWSSIGDFYGSIVQMTGLEFVGDSLYAAGSFTNVNGVAARGLARWDGNTWSSVGLGGNAYALAVEGNNLYVAGAFTNAGGVVMTNVGRWDGSAWYPLGDGLGRPNINNFCTAIAVKNGIVYVAGSFTNSGAVAVTNIARWDGNTWSAMGGTLNNVYDLAADDTSVYAVGNFTQAGTVAANYVARWDGASWNALGSGLNGAAQAAAVWNNKLYVSGGFSMAGGVPANNFAIWDGASWSAAGNGLSSTGYEVLAGETNVYAGGNFVSAGFANVQTVAAWDGVLWKPLGPTGKIDGLNNIVRALANDGTNVIVGGSFTSAGLTNPVRVALYDGNQWFALGGGFNSNVLALTFVGTNLYAGGAFSREEGGPFMSRLARWNGSGWGPVGNFSASVVNVLAPRGNDLMVAGYFIFGAMDGTANWLTRWDGNGFWTSYGYDQNSPTFLYYIDYVGFKAMAVQGANVYVSGRIQFQSCDPTLSNCTNCANVARFDGDYARMVGTGLNSNANSIAVIGNNVYFAGGFTNAGGLAVSGIARWDGATWSGVGGGIVGSGLINTLLAVGTNLYAGGTFTNIGGVQASRIARWNGTTWSALGSGVIGTVNAVTAKGDDLYVGGSFRTAGGKPSNFLARWNENMNFTDVSIRLSQARVKDQRFQFSITAIGIPSYVIETSTNRVDWIPVLTNTITPYDFAEASAPASTKFYRAKSLP